MDEGIVPPALNLRNRPLAKFAVIREMEFANRLAQAADTARIPGLNQGRLTTIKDMMLSRHGIEISLETVRKWVAGESRPRPDKMRALAALLNADEGWLATGREPEMSLKERQLRKRVSSGAVHVLAGYVMMGGGTAVLPDVKDPRAAIVDLYAIIDNRQIPVHVSVARQDGPVLVCTLPHDHHLVETIAAVQTGPFDIEFLLIRESTARLERKAVQGHYEVTLTKERGEYKLGRIVLERLKTPDDLAWMMLI